VFEHDFFDEEQSPARCGEVGVEQVAIAEGCRDQQIAAQDLLPDGLKIEFHGLKLLVLDSCQGVIIDQTGCPSHRLGARKSSVRNII